MRRWWWRSRLGRRLSAGRGVRLGPRLRISVAPGARIVLEDGCSIGEGTRLTVRGGELRLGRDARIGERCIVVVLAGVEIGAGCRIGDWVAIADAEPVFDDPEQPIRRQGVRAAPVRVQPGAIVDHRANLLAGVTIGAGARVGAHAVVAADVPPGAVVGGAAPEATVEGDAATSPAPSPAPAPSPSPSPSGRQAPR